MSKQTANGLDELKAFPEVAAALRLRIDQIVQVWIEQMRKTIPSAQGRSDEELIDNLPNILNAMGDVLTAANGTARKLIRESPKQGLTRFRQNYDVRTLMLEDRLLRRIIIEQVEEQLGRRMSREEHMTLDTVIDVMLQQSVMAFVEAQNARIQADAQSQLKYLSFLSHDLNNNLGSVTLFLQVLRQRLAELPEFARDVETLDQAQESISNTIGGMSRLLEGERLRKAGIAPKQAPVQLKRLALSVTPQLKAHVERKGLQLIVDIPDNAVAASDGELIALVLQNILGNAVKFSEKGAIHIRAALPAGSIDGEWILSVSDEGPGIADEHLGRIFEAFKRGDAHGQKGVGLGLAIASEAAKLLNAKLTVESTVGKGSRFQLALPGK